MALSAGTRLGVYEVTASLGAGGMGEVYRARDTKLSRAVAIKILPATVAGDSDRESRFQREAQILASLNHPHIAAIYGLEHAEGTRFLVLELVDGETLAGKLKTHGARGLVVDEAVTIARQIADALQAAHDKGIVHRDLKPANIALTSEGQVKVLDFGLAKFTGADGGSESSPNVSQSPTLTVAATEAGMILGTAAYMSPEQAKGRTADKRSDIWAFGCVLFEMLTGRRPFDGEDMSDTLAAILRADPDWTLLPAGVSGSLRTVVEGCLKKDRAQRIGDIAVAQFLLNQPAAAAVTAGVTTQAGSRLWKVAAAVLALTSIAGAAAALFTVRDRPAPEVTRFLIVPPVRGTFVTAGRTGSSVAISPDGRRLAYTARDEAGRVQIWLRAIDALTAVALAGTENAEFPFWSPDSRSIAYFANGKLMKIDAAGGPAQTLCEADGARGGAWAPNDFLVFGGGTGKGLQRVPSTGGVPTSVTTAPDGDHRFPSFLPDGRGLLFYTNAPGAPHIAGLYIVGLEGGQPKRLADASTGALYVSPGVLLFARQTTLIAQSFDLDTLSLTGEQTPIAEGVETGVFGGVLGYSVSENGTLAYGIGTGRGDELQLTWYDRAGRSLGSVGQPGNYFGLALSPDEKYIAAHRHEGGGDLWIIDVARNTTSRFTFEPAQDNSSPVWAPDGRRIAFASLRNGTFGLFVKALDGSTPEEPLLQGRANLAPRDWSRDGSTIVYDASDPLGLPDTTRGVSRTDILALPLSPNRQPTNLLASQFTEGTGSISPDGKWLAYVSDETGRPELYVRPFPAGAGKWQVSTGGGAEPHWRGDSKELFYLDTPQLGSLFSVAITVAGNAFSAGSPQRLFSSDLLTTQHAGPLGHKRFAVSADGKRFLLPRNPRAATFTEQTSMPIAVVTNWAAALRK